MLNSESHDLRLGTPTNCKVTSTNTCILRQVKTYIVFLYILLMSHRRQTRRALIAKSDRKLKRKLRKDSSLSIIEYKVAYNLPTLIPNVWIKTTKVQPFFGWMFEGARTNPNSRTKCGGNYTNFGELWHRGWPLHATSNVSVKRGIAWGIRVHTVG